jgi:N-acetylglutamate synthase-like GNAT family acetyltransferase
LKTEFFASPSPNTISHRPQIIIREAAARDAISINSLYQLLSANQAINVKPERIVAIANHDDHFLLVAEIEKNVCGTAFMSFCMDAMFGEQPFTVIENVIVAPARQHCGIGKKLLAQIEAMSIARASSKIMLLSSSEREAAHAFFRENGYASDKKRGFVKYRSQFSR